MSHTYCQLVPKLTVWIVKLDLNLPHELGELLNFLNLGFLSLGIIVMLLLHRVVTRIKCANPFKVLFSRAWHVKVILSKYQSF